MLTSFESMPLRHHNSVRDDCHGRASPTRKDIFPYFLQETERCVGALVRKSGKMSFHAWGARHSSRTGK